MKTIIRLELKKIYRNKLFLLILLFGFFINALVIVSNDKERVSDEFNQGYISIYDRVKGKMTQDKYDFLNTEYINAKELVDNGDYDTENPSDEFYTKYAFGDLNAFEELLNGYHYAINYKDNIKSTVNLAQDNQKYYTEKGDLLLNKHFSDNFQKRNISQYYDTIGMTKYLSYDFSTLLIVIILILAHSNIFSEEVESGQSFILSTTVFGKKKLYLYKLMTIIISTFLIASLFYCEDFIVYNSIVILDGFTNPIYSLPSFQYASIDISILQYTLFSILIKFNCLFIVSIIIYLISFLTYKVLHSIILNISIIFMMIYNTGLCFLNPFNIIILRQTIVAFQYTHFLNFNFPDLLVYYFISIVEMIMCFIGGIVIVRKKRLQRNG